MNLSATTCESTLLPASFIIGIYSKKEGFTMEEKKNKKIPAGDTFIRA